MVWSVMNEILDEISCALTELRNDIQLRFMSMYIHCIEKQVRLKQIENFFRYILWDGLYPYYSSPFGK